MNWKRNANAYSQDSDPIEDIAASPNQLDNKFIVEELRKLKGQFQGQPNRAGEFKRVERMIEQYAKETPLTFAEANEVKRGIYGRNENAYSREIDIFKSEIDMAIARGIEKGIEAQFPEAKKINEELSFYRRLSDALEKKAAKKAAKAEKRMIVKDWKRIIAKEWLIIIAITISSPVVGYGVDLYQNHVYEREIAKPFDPDEFLKKKDVPSPKKPFDPDAFLASDPPAMEDGLKIDQNQPQDPLAGLQPALRKPSEYENLGTSIILIPFVYIFLVIARLTVWSLTTVRRRQFPIQVSESNQLAPIHDY